MKMKGRESRILFSPCLFFVSFWKLTFAGSMIIMNSPQKVEFDRLGERSPE